MKKPQRILPLLFFLFFISCQKNTKVVNLKEDTKIGFDVPVTLKGAQELFKMKWGSRLGVQEINSYRSEKYEGYRFDYHRSSKSNEPSHGLSNVQNDSDTPESITVYVYDDSSELIVNALVLDYTSADFDGMRQFVGGYISMHDINGGYIGRLENVKINEFDFVLDIPETMSNESLAQGCYRTCFFTTYNELKRGCEDDFYCNSICDFAPCRWAWTYQSATKCNRICRPFGNI